MVINVICFFNLDVMVKVKVVEICLVGGDDLLFVGVLVVVKDNIWVKGLWII